MEPRRIGACKWKCTFTKTWCCFMSFCLCALLPKKRQLVVTVFLKRDGDGSWGHKIRLWSFLEWKSSSAGSNPHVCCDDSFRVWGSAGDRLMFSLRSLSRTWNTSEELLSIFLWTSLILLLHWFFPFKPFMFLWLKCKMNRKITSFTTKLL